ncbi:hypothetical protein ALC57_02092 [Trachymyrmex cornetzi]|uniref:Helix-turn-helix domain-containing protein n=1 Tax=Trachymyrmex cornetzi TaxID=471704 RepID=A0A151JP28_9HYME|nr:hypothetical protein ALC57_02092 [Trachymyrmex cornetzi]
MIFDGYRKATFSGRFLNFHSQHLVCHKRGVIYSVIDKIVRLCHPTFQQNNLIDAVNIFLNNGYLTNYDFKWNNVRILDIEPSYRKRLISEMVYIKKQTHGINRQNDTESLPDSYTNMISSLSSS